MYFSYYIIQLNFLLIIVVLSKALLQLDLEVARNVYTCEGVLVLKVRLCLKIAGNDVVSTNLSLPLRATGIPPWQLEEETM